MTGTTKSPTKSTEPKSPAIPTTKSARTAKSVAPVAVRPKKKVGEVKTEGLARSAGARKTKSVRRAEQVADMTPVAVAAAVAVKEQIYAPDLDDKEFTAEDDQRLAAMYEETISEIKEGEIVRGRVQAIGRDMVIVDVGFKSEGAIPITEFTDPQNVKVGDEVEVFLDAVEDQEGQLVLSKSKADFLRVWDNIRATHEQGSLVDGRIVRRIKGGLVVDLFGVEAFLPGSQVALRQVPDFDSLIGQSLPMKIIKLNKTRRNIVVSRRVVLEQERDDLRGRILNEIVTGQIRRGKVKNITDFGVFIDLGGVDGLLHITDMSWGRIRHPSELVAVGDEIDIKILDFDGKSHRISLGLKQLSPHPWENVESKYPIGARVTGRVVSITDYGAFVELERGVEGLVHISEMSWTHHVRHPSKIVQIGDTIEALVLNVDREHQKISLGIKQLEPDPWSTVEQRYPVASRHEGRVRNLTAFGAFVELEDGIDGLVHISDLSWTRRVQHPSEIMKKGDKVPVVVLNIDVENRKISLGHKQVIEDPWPHYHERFRVGNEMQGKVVRMLERGVVVDIDNEVEGFVPLNAMGKKDLDKPESAFTVGDMLNLRVIEFDPTNRRIVLSVDAFYKDKDRADFEQFLAAHPTRATTVAEAAGVETAPPAAASEDAGESTATVSESAADIGAPDQIEPLP
ncbi:MAG: 30S ribosomal protein S1 [candidate division Zixibacteria bacterium]|nr:30S ribosomal protein S1 [candidate division Zixibacteria bacterium]